MSVHTVTCWSCGRTWEFSPPLARSELCLGCRRDAKVCLNCRFYDRHANRECAESQAELVKDKEKSNFCDWFEANAGHASSALTSATNPLDALFGSPSNSKEKSKMEEELEAFFKKK